MFVKPLGLSVLSAWVKSCTRSNSGTLWSPAPILRKMRSLRVGVESWQVGKLEGKWWFFQTSMVIYIILYTYTYRIYRIYHIYSIWIQTDLHDFASLCINDPPWVQTGKDMSVNDPRSSWVVARWLPGHDRRLFFQWYGDKNPHAHVGYQITDSSSFFISFWKHAWFYQIHQTVYHWL